MARKILLTVTTDLNYDQRMIRICSSLTAAGYEVLLVGTATRNAGPLMNKPYQQKRLYMPFARGKLLYLFYNFRLFFFLIFQRMDCICAIDLDSILPCYFVAVLKRIPRVYDAHELFCEMKEIVTRPFIYKCWKMVERFTVPSFPHGYTVNEIIADEFKKMYGVEYAVIRNIAREEPFVQTPSKQPFILYQGAVNEGRCFENLIPAMQWINIPLVICGDGNFMEQTKTLVTKYQLEEKVIFKGKLLPQDLSTITRQASLGITLFENTGNSNYYSLANRFFDYLQAGIPQICCDYPAYRKINNLFEVAVLIKDMQAENIAHEVNRLLNEPSLYNRLAGNCASARKIFNWQEEEKKLLEFYHKLLH
jgi:glycosyltransferase involved in cell wall biosynthesis